MAPPSRHQILVVDDDPSVRETVTVLLMSAGYDVAAAGDGFGALLYLRRTLPVLIVTDLSMPNMSGFELLSVVRRRFPHILTVAMSGAYQELPPAAIADGFYAKGDHPKSLFRTVEELLRVAPVLSADRQPWLAPLGFLATGMTPRELPTSW